MQLPNDKYASLSIGRATSRGSYNLWALVQSNLFVDFNLSLLSQLCSEDLIHFVSFGQKLFTPFRGQKPLSLNVFFL